MRFHYFRRGNICIKLILFWENAKPMYKNYFVSNKMPTIPPLKLTYVELWITSRTEIQLAPVFYIECWNWTFVDACWAVFYGTATCSHGKWLDIELPFWNWSLQNSRKFQFDNFQECNRLHCAAMFFVLVGGACGRSGEYQLNLFINCWINLMGLTVCNVYKNVKPFV